ncbi:MAG TPA: ferritin-like domain-containing protein [Bdellovibrionota bacterium]|jgi:bacterioferritin|nr:ferritin-like domain-containing protein [Bdellovibrionota bacterium]
MASLSRKTNAQTMECLQKIFLAEMAGVLRYLHYSFMVMGHHRIPIQGWFRAQADEAKTHAIAIGEKITSYGGHPPLLSNKVEESNVHTLSQMLEESMGFEEAGLALYADLVSLAASQNDMALEEWARGMVVEEQDHLDEVRKMLRDPNRH